MTETERGRRNTADGTTAEPLVTVAIPTYRRPGMLRSAIDSALAQTYTNTEILVSDSEGSDEIADLVAGYGDARLRYRRNERQTNGLENALAMYRASRGELIATLHDDDEWEARYLEVMVAPLVADPTVVLTFADHWTINVQGQVLPERTEAWAKARGRAGLAEGRYQPFTRLAVVDCAPAIPAATVFRNGLIPWDEFPPEADPAYDLWMAYLACRDGGAAYYVPERLMRYRWHEESARTTTRMEANIVLTYDRMLADDRLADISAELRRAAAPARARLGMTLLIEGQTDAARKHLLKALPYGARSHAAAGLALSLLPRRARAELIQRIRDERTRRDHSWGQTPATNP